MLVSGSVEALVPRPKEFAEPFILRLRENVDEPGGAWPGHRVSEGHCEEIIRGLIGIMEKKMPTTI